MERTPIRDRPPAQEGPRAEGCDILPLSVSHAPVGLVGLDLHLIEIIGEQQRDDSQRPARALPPPAKNSQNVNLLRPELIRLAKT